MGYCVLSANWDWGDKAQGVCCVLDVRWAAGMQGAEQGGGRRSLAALQEGCSGCGEVWPDEEHNARLERQWEDCALVLARQIKGATEGGGTLRVLHGVHCFLFILYSRIACGVKAKVFRWRLPCDQCWLQLMDDTNRQCVPHTWHTGGHTCGRHACLRAMCYMRFGGNGTVCWKPGLCRVQRCKS